MDRSPLSQQMQHEALMQFMPGRPDQYDEILRHGNPNPNPKNHTSSLSFKQGPTRPKQPVQQPHQQYPLKDSPLKLKAKRVQSEAATPLQRNKDRSLRSNLDSRTLINVSRLADSEEEHKTSVTPGGKHVRAPRRNLIGQAAKVAPARPPRHPNDAIEEAHAVMKIISDRQNLVYNNNLGRKRTR